MRLLDHTKKLAEDNANPSFTIYQPEFANFLTIDCPEVLFSAGYNTENSFFVGQIVICGKQ